MRLLTHFEKASLRDRGFTILLAALVSAIVLAIGSSIFAIAQKQIILSSIGRDSQFAFYAADTAAECALYWDIRRQAFEQPLGDIGGILCDSNDPEDVQSGSAGKVHWYQYAISVSGERACATVRVTKDMTDDKRATTIRADGHNVSCATLTTSARVLQRSVEINY